MSKIFREKHKTMHNVFDAHTERQLFALIGKGIFEGLESPLSIGKEANVFTAITKHKSKVIVKIYRILAADFNRMYQYIRTDPRFEGLHNSRRKVLFAWVQREFRNLMVARNHGVRVPNPIDVGTNVLVMEYIGDKNNVAPKLKDALPKDPCAFLNKLMHELYTLYKAGFVHGDLSPYNILNDHEEPVLIDLSTATEVKDPHAPDYMERDLTNLAKFFVKLGVHTSPDTLKKNLLALEPQQQPF